MKELMTKVETNLVEVQCYCGGLMENTGTCLGSTAIYTPKFTHKCKTCGYVASLSHAYPLYRHLPIGEAREGRMLETEIRKLPGGPDV